MITSYYFQYLRDCVNAGLTVPSRVDSECGTINFDDKIENHYPENLQIYKMADISKRISSLYDGSNEEKKQACTLWKKYYDKLQQFEYQIMSDYEYVSKSKSSALYDYFEMPKYSIEASTNVNSIYDNIKGMHDICQSYHNIVEPFLEDCNDAETQDKYSNRKGSYTREQVIYLIHKSGIAKENGSAVEWAALLHIITGFSQHTIRQLFYKVRATPNQYISESIIKELDSLYDEVKESMKNKKK